MGVATWLTLISVFLGIALVIDVALGHVPYIGPLVPSDVGVLTILIFVFLVAAAAVHAADVRAYIE